MTNIEKASKEVRITYDINAPRELVFKAWTDPVQLKKWYAPDGCSIEISKMDLHKNGIFHHCIIIPGGKKCWCKGTYLEIIAPEKLVFSMVVSDEQGNNVDPVAAGMDPEWPAETIVSVRFSEQNGKTTIDLHQTVSEDLAKRTGAYPSWILMLDILKRTLKS
jgi:uncharacterized protein YndB with AHSA1/START domain